MNYVGDLVSDASPVPPSFVFDKYIAVSFFDHLRHHSREFLALDYDVQP